MILLPLAILSGVVIAFISAQIWNDLDRASAAVNRETGRLSAVLFLTAFRGNLKAGCASLFSAISRKRRNKEWPRMGQRAATFSITPPPSPRPCNWCWL